MKRFTIIRSTCSVVLLLALAAQASGQSVAFSLRMLPPIAAQAITPISANLIKDPDITKFSLPKNSPWRSTWYIDAPREELRQLRKQITHRYSPQTGATLTISSGAEYTSNKKACRIIFSQTVKVPKQKNDFIAQLKLQVKGVNASSSRVEPQISVLLRHWDRCGKIIRSANRHNILLIPARGRMGKTTVAG